MYRQGISPLANFGRAKNLAVISCFYGTCLE